MPNKNQAVPLGLSRFKYLSRLMGMKRIGSRQPIWLAIIVLAHFVISLVHGTAHAKAQVPLSPAANIFVFAVIVAGPLIGLILTWPTPKVGKWLIALTLAGALIFGVVNHFVLSGPDHVTHVDPQWRALFTTTAVLLVISEMLGSGLAVCSMWARRLR
jgi:hypothetical protein